MALVGNLRDFGLSDFLYLVDRGDKTGLLVLQRPGDKARLYFQNGRLVYAIQNGAPEKLGDLLLRAGKITAQQRNAALQLQATVAANKPLGLILVELGYITREGIIRAVRNQIEETVYRLFAWTEGEFRFEPDVRPPRESVTIPLSLENVIMEGVRRIDEWSRIRDRISNLDLVVRFADQPADRAKVVNLTPDEWRIFARINGLDNLGTVARLSGLSEFEVCRIVYGFLQAGLVETVRTAGKQPAPAARPAAAPEPSPAVPVSTAAPLAPAAPAVTASSTRTPIAVAALTAPAPPREAVPAPAPPPGRALTRVGRNVLYRIIERIRRL